MVLSNVCYLTLRAPLYFCMCFCVDWYRKYGACGIIPKYAMVLQFGLWNPGMCIPIMGYIIAISFNCIFDF